ncbi:hypothetical protein LTR85_012208 [Meristemomyces frigidus]|nr:hypothetical protein LTR85_012208 [Meristemomyces frigidus]
MRLPISVPVELTRWPVSLLSASKHRPEVEQWIWDELWIPKQVRDKRRRGNDIDYLANLETINMPTTLFRKTKFQGKELLEYAASWVPLHNGSSWITWRQQWVRFERVQHLTDGGPGRRYAEDLVPDVLMADAGEEGEAVQ